MRLLTVIVLLVLIMGGCGDTSADVMPTPAPTPTFDPDVQREINADMYVRQIQPGVFVITHAFPWPGNSMLVEMENADLVLVDTPYTPDATQDLMDWVKAELGERRIVAINTGFHYDNLGGNSCLIEQGISVYGSDVTAALLEARGPAVRAMTLEWLEAPRDRRYYQAHADLPYVVPTQQFTLEQGLELTFGDEIVQVYYPGPSHAPDNVVVYFPSRKLLFGGCMILAGDQVGNTSDADLAAWPDAVQALERFDFDVLVPGHGDRLDPGLCEHTLDLLAAFEE